jgi:lambda family phage portal protein
MKKYNVTLLDRAIAALDPAAGVRRMAARATFEALGGGYYNGVGRRGMRSLMGWRRATGNANADIIPDLADLRFDTRALGRNAPIAAGAIDRTVTNVVGPGLMLQPQIDRKILGLDDEQADEWERDAEREFKLWADSPDADATGAMEFSGLQALAFRQVLESGDCFVIRRAIERPGNPYSLALQFIEADQCATPAAGVEGRSQADGSRIVGGVEINETGEAVAYHFRKEHPGQISEGGRAFERIEKRGATSRRVIVNHLFERRRIGQARGVPMLAPVINALKQLSDYSEAELSAAVIGAMIAVVYKSKGGEGLPPSNPAEDTGSREGDRDYKIASGSVFEIDHDDDVEVPSLGRPNANFDPFFVAIVRQIGAGLEIPFEVLILHFTASYSASRAAIEMAWLMFRRRRQWLARNLCRWVYDDFLNEAVSMGRLQAPGFLTDPIMRQAWSGAVWIGPSRISLDPQRENNADSIAEDRGWKTSAEITAEKTGGDWERKHEQRRKEKKWRIRDGLEPPAAVAGAAPDPNADQPEDETKGKPS